MHKKGNAAAFPFLKDTIFYPQGQLRLFKRTSIIYSSVGFLNAIISQKSPAVFGKGLIGDSIGSIVAFPGESGRIDQRKIGDHGIFCGVPGQGEALIGIDGA